MLIEECPTHETHGIESSDDSHESQAYGESANDTNHCEEIVFLALYCSGVLRLIYEIWRREGAALVPLSQ